MAHHNGVFFWGGGRGADSGGKKPWSFVYVYLLKAFLLWSGGKLKTMGRRPFRVRGFAQKRKPTLRTLHTDGTEATSTKKHRWNFAPFWILLLCFIIVDSASCLLHLFEREKEVNGECHHQSRHRGRNTIAQKITRHQIVHCSFCGTKKECPRPWCRKRPFFSN